MRRSRVLAVLCILLTVFLLAGCDSQDYKEAMSLYEAGSYSEAIVIFTELGDYEDSASMVLVCKYAEADVLFAAGDYEAAKAVYAELGDYENSSEMVSECIYRQAENLYSSGSYEEAIALYETIPQYKDSEEKITSANKAFMQTHHGNDLRLLTAETWFFNGGSESALNQISFTVDTASITQWNHDMDGRHNMGTNSYPYLMDDENITITLAEDSELVIPYNVVGEQIKLGSGEYFTAGEVKAGLQGYWNSRENESTYWDSTSEYTIYLGKTTIKYEYALEPYGASEGQYYYYGPFEGSYTVDSAGLSADVIRGSIFSFNIVDGKVTLLRHGFACTSSEGFKGKKGYSF